MAGKWRYGLVLHLNEQYGNWYGLHTVYPHDDGGNPTWSQQTVKVLSDDPFDIPQELEMMKRDIEIHPVVVTRGREYIETLPLAECMEKYPSQSGGDGLNMGNEVI